MKGYLIMSDFKDIDLSKFSLDLTKNMQYVNPVQDQMARIQREQEQTIRSIQKAREEKEAEELRRHNEIVAALKEAGEKGATIVIGDNANGIQIQQNSDGAMQEMPNFLSCFPSCFISKQTRRLESSTLVLWLNTLRLPETYSSNAAAIRAASGSGCLNSSS